MWSCNKGLTRYKRLVFIFVCHKYYMWISGHDIRTFTSEREIGLGQLRKHEVVLMNTSSFRRCQKPISSSPVNVWISWREINIEYIIAQKKQALCISLNLCYQTTSSVEMFAFKTLILLWVTLCYKIFCKIVVDFEKQCYFKRKRE